MEDISPELLKKIQNYFHSEYANNDSIKRLFLQIQNGTATYKEANEFAIEVGDILARAYKNNLSSSVLPDGKMYYNIAKSILSPTMENNYNLITNVTNQIQKSLNASAGIGIKPITPKLNQNRIDGIINRVSNEDVFDDVSWILDEPVKNFSQSIVDDSIKVNSEFHAKSGLQPIITRKLAGGCCEWCAALAGTYSYPDVPKDVYRRHQRCRCTVDYIPGNGKFQNVHTKQWFTEDKEKIELRKGVGINKFSGKDVTPWYYGTSNPKKGIITQEEGFKITKHSKEIEMAEFLNKIFGGDITLLNEVKVQNVKTADFLWNEKLWDLKTVTTDKAADSAIRKGLKQIQNNPGGIILDYRGQNTELDKIMKVVENRMQRGCKDNTDIMVILDENKIKIFRYKK